ncbi:Glutathione-regulated potassium-efflux system protein KefC [Planctomycetes bacterium Pla163]|uniref:Glutathione-regulated potassium-efflux system protein KefC n=1 Tax=Rohdeia mirabilis TaxID=2528008 RepID=A0A518D554_9BACT|nr:Glutathione-regulated potassium-efflux system protein KefC [Planctomycetes bacterium Pla163]
MPLALAAADPAAWSILLQILVLLGVALALAIVSERLRQSAILGYLAAGALLGPGVLGIVEAESGLPVIAELGVSLLLFAIGLEFSVSRLLKLGRIALVGGSLQVVATLALASLVAMAFGYEVRTALAVGAIVALSSTASVLRILIDRTELDSVHGRSALGILLMQDVSVVPLVLLVTVMGGEGGAGEIGVRLLEAVALLVALVGGFHLVLNRLLARVVAGMNFARDRELLVLLAATLALGSAAAAHAVDVSPALGAFIAGIMLAESPFATQIRSDVSALRVLFVTLFFASVGMLGDPIWIADHAGAVALVVVLVLLGKAAIVAVVAMWLRVPLRHAVAAGVALAQVGEFGVVIAGIARGNGLVDDHLFRLLVSATLVTLFATPFLIRGALPIGNRLARQRRGAATFDDTDDVVEPGHGAAEVFIVGFGPAGQEVGRELHENGRETLVLDLGPSNVDLARSIGLRAAVGDATSTETLIHHGIEHARALVIALPDHAAAQQIVAAVRTLAPSIQIIVRARYHRLAPELTDAGATVVVDEEYQTGRRLAAAVRSVLTDESRRSESDEPAPPTPS